jgi:hypothetical protein
MGNVTRMGEKRNAHILVGTPERNTERTRSWFSSEDSIKMCYIRCENEGWIHLAQERDQWWTVVNFRFS